jgi:hypothetical protein
MQQRREGKMKVAAKQELRDLAQKNGWSSSFAEGYIDGREVRMLGRLVANYPLADLDQYRAGFLAGYSLMREKRCGGAPGWTGSEAVAARRSR